MHQETETITIREPLSSMDLQQLNWQYAQINIEMSRTLEQYQTVKADYMGRIKKMREQAAEQLAVIREGYSERPVAAIKQPDFSQSVMRLLDPDTGEVLRERPLLPEERQTSIITMHAAV